MDMRVALIIVAGLLPLPLAAKCRTADIASAGITGFQEAVISVSDLKTATETWREVGDFEVLCEGRPDPRLAQFWGLPPGTKISQVVLRKKSATRGFVTLVKFHDVVQQQIRSSAQTWDSGGILDLYMYVDDVHSVFDKLRARGWQGYNDPVTYTLGVFTITEALMRGPDGEVLCLMQRDAPPYDKARFGLVAGSGKGFGWPFNAALVSTELEPGVKFFRDVLGWKMHLGGESRAAPPGDTPMGLPRNLAQSTARRFAAFAPHPTDRNGSIQVYFNDGLEGRDLASRAHAPNLGILTLRVPVADMNAFEQEVIARGAVIAAPRQTLALEPYGVVEVLALRAPNGATLEFFAPRRP